MSALKGARPASPKAGSGAVGPLHEASELTGLLNAWASGNRGAQERLFKLVYPELRRLAHRQLAREPSSPTLQSTELVHEAYMRLTNQKRLSWQCRAQFFALSTTLIRRILVDRARSRLRKKRGSGAVHISLESANLRASVAAPTLDLLALDRALTELAQVRATSARIVELRFFAGLDVEETAATLHLGTATVVRQWRFARAWLSERLDGKL